MSKEFKEASKDNFSSKDPFVTEGQIQLGCLQRIADATEKMAMNHSRLIDERDYLRCRNNKLTAEMKTLKRSLAATRRYLNKAKHEILELKQQQMAEETAGKEEVS